MHSVVLRVHVCPPFLKWPGNIDCHANETVLLMANSAVMVYSIARESPRTVLVSVLLWLRTPSHGKRLIRTIRAQEEGLSKETVNQLL